ncbi:MAG TPA: hypothetical protein VF214_05370, partial [Edaphobacter sp.]
MTVSAGVTERLGPGDSWAAMVNRADRLLYQAKSAGRNCVMLDEQAARQPKPAAAERYAGVPQTVDRTTASMT